MFISRFVFYASATNWYIGTEAIAWLTRLSSRLTVLALPVLKIRFELADGFNRGL